MKIIHTSDWHFGRTDTRGRSFQDCHQFFLERLYDLIREEKAEAVICAGDVYDTAVSGPEAIRLYNDAATTLCRDLGVTFIVIAGNHDGATRLSACNKLLESANLYVTGNLERDPKPVLLDGGKVAVYSLPFFQRDHIVSLFPEKKEEIRTIAQGARVYCDHIRQQMSPDRRNILVSHSFLVNAELSDGDSERSAHLGTASALPASVFEGFDYVALGHIHKPQSIAPHIRYSGSPIKFSFGAEEKQTKGVVVIDTDTMEQRFVPLELLRDWKTLVGTYEEVRHREDLREAYLQIQVTDRRAGLDLQGELRDFYPHLLGVTGKSLIPAEGKSTLTLEKFTRLKDVDILGEFMRDIYGLEVREEELALFRRALEDCEKEEGE